MRVRQIALISGAVLLSLAGVAATRATAADDGHATTRQLMLGIVIPASDGVFGVGSKEPKNDMEWEVIEADAMVLAEAGRLLLTGGRAKDQGEWKKHSQSLIDTSLLAEKYAREKNVDKVLDAGNAVYEACELLPREISARARRQLALAGRYAGRDAHSIPAIFAACRAGLEQYDPAQIG